MGCFSLDMDMDWTNSQKDPSNKKYSRFITLKS